MKNIKLLTYVKVVCFLLLLVVAIKYPTNSFDKIIADLIEIKLLGSLAKIISLVFNDKLLLVIMILLSVFLAWIKELPKAVFMFFTAGFGGLLLTVVKYSVQRVRPLPDVHDGFSFPSGHSTFVILFFLALTFIINKKNLVRVIGIFAIILVPISRLILGAHFLTDVVAGLLLGSIVVDLMKIYYIDIYNILMGVIGRRNE
ncbi:MULTISPECIES: phosphatase PAP2 family protein [Gemella]|uniref:phosphatase PAP2 family protein n=1 Tax=Gemella TaxID=1378 RepID=UPI000767E3C8|nr:MULTISPECIES: phosphatase PAP2 family protein [Gemella]AME09789.1 phospholipid phosphatase [Gemella sp. oral taxon 928]AXI27389.1 PAP2 family protein [Gemella sp. ND 6198]